MDFVGAFATALARIGLVQAAGIIGFFRRCLRLRCSAGLVTIKIQPLKPPCWLCVHVAVELDSAFLEKKIWRAKPNRFPRGTRNYLFNTSSSPPRLPVELIVLLKAICLWRNAIFFCRTRPYTAAGVFARALPITVGRC